MESFPLVVQRAGFVAGSGVGASTILINGTARGTSCAATTSRVTGLNPADVASAATSTIQVRNPGPNGALAELQGAGAYDLESLLTHELGHWMGLDHSAVIRALMFPFAPPPGQYLGNRPDGSVPDGPLADDDRTGMRAQYPDPNDTRNVSAIRGRIVPANLFALATFAAPSPGVPVRNDGRARGCGGRGNRLSVCGDAGRLELRCDKSADAV